MTTRPAPHAGAFVRQLWWAVLSGILLGAAFPPVDAKLLVWLGLAPLLLVCLNASRVRDAFVFGYAAGFVCFLMHLHPLVSVHSWTGWAAESSQAFASRMSQQEWFMNGIWLAFAVWCAVFWGFWAAGVRWLWRGRPWRLLVVAPALWVLVPEMARASGTFGFCWAFLGNATADWPAVRQAAALGGVWLLSVLVVVGNVAAILACRFGWRREGRGPLAAALLVLALAVGAGAARLARWPASRDPFLAAAVQHHKPAYATSDFAGIGIDHAYLTLLQQAVETGARLIVLPESVALGAVSLDGSPSTAKPPEWQHPRAGWDRQLAVLLRGRDAVVVIGLDTVEAGADHNTLVAWRAGGPAGWYHKRRLVPFSEYDPWAWAPWAIRGKSQYAPGRGPQLIRAGDLVIGSFICQEVLFPWVTRTSVRAGAEVLVSGGNDGVFGDPAVTRVHADAAQIRAVETGRYVVRAMKTGISEILDPLGHELVRSRSSEPVLLTQRIGTISDITPYVRFGDWVLWLAGIAVLGCVVGPWKPHPPS